MTKVFGLFTAVLASSFLFAGSVQADEVTLEAKKAAVQKLGKDIHDLRVTTASAVSRTDATSNARQKDMLSHLSACELSHIDATSGDFTFDGNQCPMSVNFRMLRYELSRNQSGEPQEEKETEQNYVLREEAFTNTAGLKYMHEHTFLHRGTLVSSPIEVVSISRDLDIHLSTGEVVKVIQQTEVFKNMESEQLSKRATYTFDFGTYHFSASYFVELDRNDQVAKERLDFAGTTLTREEMESILGAGFLD